MKIKIEISELWEPEMGYIRNRFSETTAQSTTLQTHYMDSTLKRRGDDRFNVESTWCVCRVCVPIVPLTEISSATKDVTVDW